MRRIDGIVGNRNADPDLGERIAAHERNGTLERVVLDPAERKKSRLRVETDAGTDLGIVVDRSELRAGDVLFVDPDRAAVVTFGRLDAYVVELPAGKGDLAAAVELGHRIGNQHWDVAVEDGTVYVPVEADRRVLENVLEASVPRGAKTRYESVEASTFLDSPARDLTDGDARADHDTDHARPSDRPRPRDNDRPHDHDRPRDHDGPRNHDRPHDHDSPHAHSHGDDHARDHGPTGTGDHDRDHE